MFKILLNYIRLPHAISPRERHYLTKMNRRGLGLFVAQIPCFMLVAWANGTGVLDALWLCALTLIGPLMAYATFKNPRHVSLLYGFAAMCFGGVLVHVGQGPMQIEMHFYFFILIAMLAIYANPLVIIVAAATVTAHHLLLYFLLPSSVFNYEAPIWVVLVHALFVVVESAAVVVLARGFFDNVIGLERIVVERTRELNQRNMDMRLVLDNVSQGLMTISVDGLIAPEYSTVLCAWFDEPIAGASLSELLAPYDGQASTWLELGLDAVREDAMPLELCIAQLPSSLEMTDRILSIDYAPIFEGMHVKRLLVTFTDMTSHIEQERLDQEKRELVAILSCAYDDRHAFLHFFEEAEHLIEALRQTPLIAIDEEFMRHVHTLKGNAGFFGLKSLMTLCHDLETSLQRHDLQQAQRTLDELLLRWSALERNLRQFVASQKDFAKIHHTELDRLLDEVRSGLSRRELLSRVQSWRADMLSDRLAHFAKQAREIAEEIGKPNLQVDVLAGDIALDSKVWAPFWNAFIHIIRNAIDHGVEWPDERLQRKKTPQGHLRLSATLGSGHLTLTIEDDGGGIDWQRLKQRSAALGMELPPGADLTRLLFIQGVSSRDEVTSWSGRGVGMSVVFEECARLGGKIEVDSVLGQGTSFRFVFPDTLTLSPDEGEWATSSSLVDMTPSLDEMRVDEAV